MGWITREIRVCGDMVLDGKVRSTGTLFNVGRETSAQILSDGWFAKRV